MLISMASSMIVQTAIFLSAILFASGLYEDQAGTYDWKQDYVGKVQNILWESVSHGGSGKKVFVATDRNIIASLNTHDGSIAWRQVSEEGPRGKINALLYNGNYIVTVQAGGKFVRSWHAPTGNLHWETFLPSDDTMSAPAMFLNGDRDSVIVATSESLVSLKTSDGKKEWETALPDSDTVQRWYLTVRNNGDIVAVGVSPGLRVTVVTVGVDGKVKKTPRKLPAQWVQKDTSCQAVGGVAFVCYTADTTALQFLALAEGQVFKPFPFTELGSLKPTGDTGVEGVTEDPGLPPLLLLLLRVSRTHMALLNVSDAGVMLQRDLPKVEAADVAYEGETKVLLTVQRADPETVEFTGVDLTTMKEQTDVSQRISLLANHGSVEKIFPMLFSKKKDGRLGAKVLMVTQDFALHCAHKAGKAPWHREEALAYIVAVEMVDLPVSENEAKFEDEFGSSRDDIFAMFVKRIKVQLSQLKAFAKHLLHKLSGHHHHQSIISKTDAGDVNSDEDDDDDDDEDGDLVRDSFSLHKMIVAVTAAGKVFGMRSHNGKLAWQHFFPGLAPFSPSSSDSGSSDDGGQEAKLLLFVQRTTAHFPHAPQCAVLGTSRVTGNGLLFTFNPVTGAMLTDTPPNGLDLGYKVIQAQLLYDLPDENFLKGVLLIDSNVKIHFFPESAKSLVRSQNSKMFLHLTDTESGLMNGYWVLNRGQDLVAEKVWSIDLQGGQQRVTGVYTKRPIEHVHSQGRVLGDRSVLYKYLNPNLVVVVAEGEEASPVSTAAKGPSGFFNVYLVDAVTGHIVFHENHKRTRGPVNVVHAENWVVYSLYSEKHRRYEMAVLELYEGKEQNNATAFSSLAPPPHPLVLRQSYIFPVPIRCMASSVTEKGITNKNIIMALKVGGVLSLPKALLDPRRPSIPSQETMEEGTIPYIPELPVSTENFINYNRSIFNVRGIHTAPAGLESTSLVLIYGSDIFYTRVMPSKMFDVLKEDFDYIFIAAVLAIMIVVSVISQKLAARKALKRAWK